ncbi:Ctr copper transporter [Cynara cardunculus var. scolymus]|uniref:Ctr copper transporter n=1 Tax=Cynara cardunculus var. scolymus TaxID=59895 RepID=A0A103XPP4_CYNCS|nr:Ctr copper transporter [Cynara cardunculus var. scolymus]
MAMPPTMNVSNGTVGMLHRWPGTDMGMYVLALVFVFFLAFLVEWLAHCSSVMMKSNGLASGLAQTLYLDMH